MLNIEKQSSNIFVIVCSLTVEDALRYNSFALKHSCDGKFHTTSLPSCEPLWAQTAFQSIWCDKWINVALPLQSCNWSWVMLEISCAALNLAAPYWQLPTLFLALPVMLCLTLSHWFTFACRCVRQQKKWLQSSTMKDQALCLSWRKE